MKPFGGFKDPFRDDPFFNDMGFGRIDSAFGDM